MRRGDDENLSTEGGLQSLEIWARLPDLTAEDPDERGDLHAAQNRPRIEHCGRDLYRPAGLDLLNVVEER